MDSAGSRAVKVTMGLNWGSRTSDGDGGAAGRAPNERASELLRRACHGLDSGAAQKELAGRCSAHQAAVAAVWRVGAAAAKVAEGKGGLARAAEAPGMEVVARVVVGWEDQGWAERGWGVAAREAGWAAVAMAVGWAAAGWVGWAVRGRVTGEGD